jgi:hypothetical protein
MQILSSGGPPLVFQGGQVFQFHWQVASLGIHQDSSGQGNFGCIVPRVGKIRGCGCIPSLPRTMMHEREIIHEQSLREQMARERLAFSNIPSIADAGMHDPNHSGGINKMHHSYDLNASLPREAAFPRPVVGQQHQFLNQQEQYFASMNNANAIPFNNGIPHSNAPSANGFKFERARHSIQHRRITEEAWNALSWESKMRVYREKGIHPNSAMHLSHGN